MECIFMIVVMESRNVNFGDIWCFCKFYRKLSIGSVMVSKLSRLILVS